MIKHLNFLSIDAGARQKAGMRKLHLLQRVLQDPMALPEQRARAQHQIMATQAWMRGEPLPELEFEPLPESLPVAVPDPSPTPAETVAEWSKELPKRRRRKRNHVVDVVETVGLKEDVE